MKSALIFVAAALFCGAAHAGEVACAQRLYAQRDNAELAHKLGADSSSGPTAAQLFSRRYASAEDTGTAQDIAYGLIACGASPKFPVVVAYRLLAARAITYGVAALLLFEYQRRVACALVASGAAGIAQTKREIADVRTPAAWRAKLARVLAPLIRQRKQLEGPPWNCAP